MSRISLRHLFSRLARRPAPPRTTLRLEGLEERRNPVSASVSFNPVTNVGVLTVSGTGPAINDRIILIRHQNGLSVFDNRFGTMAAVPITNADGFGTTRFTMDYSLLQGADGSGIRV